MKINVLSVAYQRPIELLTLCCCFLRQTNPNWELTIMYDGAVPKQIQDIMNLFDDKRIIFKHTDTRNGKWGHPNRRKMLEEMTYDEGDFVLLTNDDNIYVPEFVEQMIGVINENANTGLVMCNTIHSYQRYELTHTQLKEGFIDMGCFIVRCDVAKGIGFKHDHFSADGTYAEECGAKCREIGLNILHLQRPLFIHC